MKSARRFIKEDTSEIESWFWLLPMFAAQKNMVTRSIEMENVNGYKYKQIGRSLNMDLDLKIFSFLIKEKTNMMTMSLHELMLHIGFTTKRIDSKTKAAVMESIDKMSEVSFKYESKKRRGALGVISNYDFCKENEIIEIEMSAKLIEICTSKRGKMFLNYNDLEKKYGKKMIAKKLHLFIKSFGNNKSVKFKWDNIINNLGMHEQNTVEAKKRIRKELKFMMGIGEIFSYSEIDKDVIEIEINEKYRESAKSKSSKIKTLNKKMEKSIPF